MITMEVDGRKVQANEGETILAALRREGIHVPTLCHMDGLPPSGACRLCVVEVEGAANLKAIQRLLKSGGLYDREAGGLFSP